MKLYKMFIFAVMFLIWGISVFAALDIQFIGAIKQSQDPAAVGNEITFTVSFKPASGAVSNFKITGGVDGVKILNRVYSSIAADKIKTESYKWTATNGSHKVWFELDPDHTAGDSNYSNNRIEKTITVGSNISIILNDKARPDMSDMQQLADVFRDRMAEKTDIYVVDVYATDVNGNVLGQIKNQQKFKLNCKFRRAGPQPPGVFYVDLFEGGEKAKCTNNSCFGYISDKFKIAVSDEYLVHDTDFGSYPMECHLKWQDPNYKDADMINNYMKKMIFVD